MNPYIESCYKMFKEVKKVNEWFIRHLAHAIVETVKEAVEVCKND